MVVSFLFRPNGGHRMLLLNLSLALKISVNNIGAGVSPHGVTCISSKVAPSGTTEHP